MNFILTPYSFCWVCEWLNKQPRGNFTCVFFGKKNNLLRLYHAKYHLAEDLPTSLKQLQKLGICMILSAVGGSGDRAPGRTEISG